MVTRRMTIINPRTKVTTGISTALFISGLRVQAVVSATDLVACCPHPGKLHLYWPLYKKRFCPLPLWLRNELQRGSHPGHRSLKQRFRCLVLPRQLPRHSLRALANFNRKRFSMADADVRKAIEVAPQNSFGYVQLGNLRFSERQFEDAGNAYQAALNRNQNSKDALRGLISTYIAQKRVDQAISTANAQIAKAPNISRIL